MQKSLESKNIKHAIGSQQANFREKERTVSIKTRFREKRSLKIRTFFKNIVLTKNRKIYFE